MTAQTSTPVGDPGGHRPGGSSAATGPGTTATAAPTTRAAATGGAGGNGAAGGPPAGRPARGGAAGNGLSPAGTVAGRPSGSGIRFRGWVIVAAAFTVLAVAYGTQFCFGVFVTEITKETGWSRTQLTTPYALYVGMYSFLSGVSGWATDRFGPRRAIAIGAVFLGAGWALLGTIHALWQVYLLLGLVAGIGMSVSWVPCNATVVRWFVRRRGTAVGITSSGGSFGNLLAPPVATLLIASFGWRHTLEAMGVTAAVIMMIAAAFMIRSPEEVGLHPDGDPEPPKLETGSGGGSFTLAQARRTRVFWVMFSIFALTWLAVFVPFAHVVAFAKDLGISSFQASWALSAIGFGGISGRLSAGPLSDWLGRKAILGATLAIQAVCFVGFASAHGLAVILISAFFFGVSYGGSVTAFPALVGDEFGRANAGMIVGAIFATAGTVAAVGPFLAAALYDHLHSYRLAFLLGAAVNVVAFVLVPLLGPGRAAGGTAVARPARRADAAKPLPAAVPRGWFDHWFGAADPA